MYIGVYELDASEGNAKYDTGVFANSLAVRVQRYQLLKSGWILLFLLDKTLAYLNSLTSKSGFFSPCRCGGVVCLVCLGFVVSEVIEGFDRSG